MDRQPYPQFIESVLSGAYAPRAGRLVEVTTAELAEKMRARAAVISNLSKTEATELTDAATLLDIEGSRPISLHYTDAARLVGPQAAKSLGASG